MSELTLLILRVGFLLLLWGFILSIVYALRSDLFGMPVRRRQGKAGPVIVGGDVDAAAGSVLPTAAGTVTSAAGSGPVAAGQQPAPSSLTARHLAIVAGVAKGTVIDIGEGPVTIGRSADSTLVIVDEFTSTYHARLDLGDTGWVITDLDSTNGTRLAGARIQTPTVVGLDTPIAIGTTVFELRP